MKLTKKWIYTSALVTVLLAILGAGKILDWQAEQIVEKLYPRDQQGIIKGLESISIKRQYSAALLLLHGFGSSPAVFAEMIDTAKKQKLDIYAPLLPYHGRNLQTFAQLDNEEVVQYAADDIYKLSRQYSQVTVLGFSYSGAILIELLKRNLIPTNVQIILYAPGVYIKGNNTNGDLLLNTYSAWRDYCNYPALGCDMRSNASGDDNAKEYFMNEKSFGYVVTPAVKQLYKMDSDNRNYLSKIQQPFYLIMARDDNRISYEEVAKACKNRSNCRLHIFPSGRHYLLLSKYKRDFNGLVTQIATNKSNH